MATRTRDELRTLVRTQLDVDDVELPDATIDSWLEDGFERSLAVEDRWPFFEDSWSITTVAGQVPYSKATIQAADANGYGIDQIISISDYTSVAYDLQSISHDIARSMFGTGLVGAGGVPAYWSEFAQSIYIWPAPPVGRLLRIDGYRKPKWSVGDAVAPDCDERMHLSLFYFACAMSYAQQEDEVLSAEYMKHWQAALQQAHSKIMATPPHRPLIMSRGAFSSFGTNVAYP